MEAERSFKEESQALGIKQQIEAEKNIISSVFGSYKPVGEMDSLDVEHIMNAVSVVDEFGDRRQVATASLISPVLYHQVRKQGYTWRKLQSDSVRPQVAIYLDCIARKEELRIKAGESLRRLREGGNSS